MNGKPNPEYDDPVELAAIKDAAERMGDYKLKSALDYTVPDHLRMNTDKARCRLLVVKEKVSFLLCIAWPLLKTIKRVFSYLAL